MPALSSVARLQQGLALFLVACAIAWLVSVWPRSPSLAVLGGLGIALVHSWFLALEFVLMPWVSRRDPTPRPGIGQLIAAWVREVVRSTQVFGWRQPFAWDAIPDAAGASRGRGIVFIHGFVCNRGFWTPWLHEARTRGHPFIAVNLEPVFGSIDDYSRTIDEAVARLTEATGRPPVLVCHSMGGLAARAWLRSCGQPSRVAHVVTIGSPHHGTWLARFGRARNGRQMRPGGEWLAELATYERAGRPGFTCWYSNCDNVVFPPSTATLPGADNRLLPGAAHLDLAFRAEPLHATFDLLAALQDPAPLAASVG